MENIPITITKEDYNNSSKSYMDNNNCPLATAAKRVLGNKNIAAGIGHIRDSDTYEIIYTLSKPFRNRNFEELKDEGVEFSTELVPV